MDVAEDDVAVVSPSFFSTAVSRVAWLSLCSVLRSSLSAPVSLVVV